MGEPIEGAERERLIDDLLLLLPVLGRELSRIGPRRVDEVRGVMGCEIGLDASGGISPGHVQVLISLSGGPRSVGSLASEIGVSSPAVTQLVDRLVGHGMVERRPAEWDGRVVLVDLVPEMRELARSVTGAYRSVLADQMSAMDDQELRAFIKGTRLLATGVGSLESSLARSADQPAQRGAENETEAGGSF